MAKAMKIAIIDDERDMRQSISQWLALSGYDTQSFASAKDALAVIDADYPGIVISDIKMPNMDGIQFLRKLMSIDSSLPVILITGHGDVPMAVEAMRIGAFDFLEKPFDPDRMSALAKKASQKRRMTLDNRELRKELSDAPSLMKKLMGKSSEMAQLREDILDLAQSEGHVLIDGETVTGKTLVAHALHAASPRAEKAFALISASAFAGDALCRRLFGPVLPEEHFLPAVEEVRGGTLVIEDIEALDEAAEAKLLSYINEQGESPETRIFAISNFQEAGRTLEDCMRKDLFYRLQSHHITVPPLRKRGNDILDMFTDLCDRFAEDYGCESPVI